MVRRGKVRSIRSDNGTNFISADNELRKALEGMNQEQIRMEQIELHSRKIRLVLHIWVESGSARFEVLEISLLPY